MIHNPVLQGIDLRKRCDSLGAFISAIDTLQQSPVTGLVVDGAPIPPETSLRQVRENLAVQLNRYTKELDALVSLYGGR